MLVTDAVFHALMSALNDDLSANMYDISSTALTSQFAMPIGVADVSAHVAPVPSELRHASTCALSSLLVVNGDACARTDRASVAATHTASAIAAPPIARRIAPHRAPARVRVSRPSDRPRESTRERATRRANRRADGAIWASASSRTAVDLVSGASASSMAVIHGN